MTGDDLVSRAKRGDRVAFDGLVGPHIEPAYRLAYGMLHDRIAAEDAVQEAALRAWRKLSNLKPGSDLGPWFLAIVANQARKAAGNRWARVVQGLPIASGPAFEDHVVRGADVRSALRRLSLDQREALLLRYFLDLPLAEVANITGVPIGTVKSRINRALSAMRLQLESVEVRC